MPCIPSLDCTIVSFHLCCNKSGSVPTSVMKHGVIASIDGVAPLWMTVCLCCSILIVWYAFDAFLVQWISVCTPVKGSLPSCILQYADLKKTLTNEPRPLPPSEGLVFGEQFSDHMLTAEWHEEKGWSAPEIKPLENLSLHPGASVFHYGIEVCESRWYTQCHICVWDVCCIH